MPSRSSRLHAVVWILAVGLGSLAERTRLLVSSLLAVAIVVVPHVQAATITLPATDVNRLLSVLPTTHFSDYFSTMGASGNDQRTLVYTSGSTFDGVITAALGTNDYVINSVTLTVGSSGTDSLGYGPYTSAGAKGACAVLTAYNTATVTWNSFNFGGTAGVNYSSSPISTGTIVGDTVVWTFSPALIQGWIDTPSSNTGLFFPDYGGNVTNDTTPAANVVWTINAVPEPSTYAMALAGLACGGFSMWRRRKRA